MKRFLACAALLGLAACGSESGPAVDDVTSAPGPAPGSWKIKIEMLGRVLDESTVCVEKQLTIADIQKIEDPSVTCTPPSAKREMGAILLHSECKVKNGMTVTSDARITGDLKTAYTMVIDAKTDPAPSAALAQTVTTITATRLGDCKP